jgi:hypothetical protein
MPSNWNKGLTKNTSIAVKKISDTMKNKKIDNFKVWRERMKLEGKIKSEYLPLAKNGDLAELIGVTLGDGHICVYPRTEELRITSNANNIGFINRYAILIKNVFGKDAYITHSSTANATKIGLYEKHISDRMAIPSGSRKYLDNRVPGWILRKKSYIVRYLRGLYEAEGSFCVHQATSTYKLFFSNRNESLLANVFNLMNKLGFHPHRSLYQVQISKKTEVYKAIEVLGFRKY